MTSKKKLAKDLEALQHRLANMERERNEYKQMFEDANAIRRKEADDAQKAAQAPKIKKILAAGADDRIEYTVTGTDSTVKQARADALASAADSLPDDYEVTKASWQEMESDNSWNGAWVATLTIVAEPASKKA